MKIEPWMDDIEPDDLPEDLQGLAHEIGFEHTLVVMRLFDGCQTYFRRVKTSMIHVRNRVIMRKWTGYNLKELANEFDLTERQIQKILADDGRQAELFPDSHSARKANSSPT